MGIRQRKVFDIKVAALVKRIDSGDEEAKKDLQRLLESTGLGVGA